MLTEQIPVNIVAEARAAYCYGRKVRSAGYHLVQPSEDPGRIPWLFSWEALQEELARRGDRQEDLLYAVMKLAPANDEGAQVLNCVAHTRARWARHMEDLRQAHAGLELACQYARETALRYKTYGNLAWATNLLGLYKKAAELSSELLVLLPQDHPYQINVRYILGMSWASSGLYAESERAFRSLLPMLLSPEGDSFLFMSKGWLAQLAVCQYQDAQAEELLALIPESKRDGPTWILAGTLAWLYHSDHNARSLIARGLEMIRVETWSWPERYSLVLGYRVLTLMSHPEQAKRFRRLARFYSDVGEPRWLKTITSRLNHKGVSPI